MTAVAKLFKNGASQAVRLPKAFRFDGQEVCIKRVGAAVILYPRRAAWDIMENALGKCDDDFMPQRHQPTRGQRRRSLGTRRGSPS